MVDVRRQKSEALGILASNETTESTRDQHRLQVSRLKSRLLQQKFNPRTNRSTGELEFAHISLGQHDRRTGSRGITISELEMNGAASASVHTPSESQREVGEVLPGLSFDLPTR